MHNVEVISFPRSGRTWFRTLVNRYCHPGNPKPDFTEEPEWLTFIHDYYDTTPILPEKHYVVLSRDPYRCIESYRALAKSAHAKQWWSSQNEAFENWLLHFRKWILPLEFPAPRLVIAYEDLTNYPVETIVNFLRFAGAEDINEPWARKVVEGLPPRKRPISEVKSLQVEVPW